jgi:hypothetical protein
MVRRAQMIGKQVQRLNKTTMGRKIVSTAGDAAQTAGRVATSESTREAVATAGRSAGQMVGSAATTAVAGANQAANRMFELQTPGGRGATAGNGTEIMGDGAATEVVTGAGSREWVYVPRLNPGETVTVDVLVGTAKRVVGTQRFPFRILSKPIADENATPLIEEGVIRIAGTSLWRRLWWVLALAIVVLGGVLAYFVLTLVW